MSLDFFVRSRRALAAERGREILLALALALTLLGLWGAALSQAEVSLVEVSLRASVTSGAAAAPVTTLVGGRIEEARLGLGRRVAAGETLVLLRTEHLRLERDAAEAELAGVRAQLAASTRERQAITDAIAAQERGRRVRTAELRARAREAAVETELAANQAARSVELAAAGVEAQEVGEQSQGRVEMLQARATSRRRQVARTATEARESIAHLRVELAQIDREEAALRGALGRHEAELRALDRKLAEHVLQAPIAGVLGEVAPHSPGEVVAPNQTLAHVIPGGDLRIVAEFSPAALGRIEPGQPARLRLDSFPWLEYGVMEGVVLRVASEPEGGTLRVECSVEPTSAPAIDLEHGLTGVLEIEVERLSPARLFTRSVGRALRSAAPGSRPSPGGS